MIAEACKPAKPMGGGKRLGTGSLPVQASLFGRRLPPPLPRKLNLAPESGWPLSRFFRFTHPLLHYSLTHSSLRVHPADWFGFSTFVILSLSLRARPLLKSRSFAALSAVCFPETKQGVAHESTQTGLSFHTGRYTSPSCSTGAPWFSPASFFSPFYREPQRTKKMCTRWNIVKTMFP